MRSNIKSVPLGVVLITLSPRTVRRHLRRLGYRLIRPIPFVASPDPDYEAKVEQLQYLKEQASLGKIVLLYEDEVDLNLLLGVLRCWTKRGTQKKVMTPGKNVKRYGFGVVDFVSGKITFLTSEHKNSASFVDLVKAILTEYAWDERPVVLIRDNCRIHSSKITQKGLASYKDRIQTFFLPTYSPCLALTKSSSYGNMSDEMSRTTIYSKALQRSHKQFTALSKTSIRNLRRSYQL